MKSQGETIHGSGFICGTLSDGREAFTNGHLIVVGKPRSNQKSCRPEKNILRNAVKDFCLKNAPKAKQQRIIDHGTYSVVVFNGQTGAWKEYLDEIKKRFPKSTLFLGRRFQNENGRYIVAKQDGKIVAILAPMRY